MEQKAYLPAYYSTYLDSMVSREARRGQGGHMEGSSAEVW